jgi:hypothetical protein
VPPATRQWPCCFSSPESPKVCKSHRTMHGALFPHGPARWKLSHRRSFSSAGTSFQLWVSPPQGRKRSSGLGFGAFAFRFASQRRRLPGMAVPVSGADRRL